MANEDFANKPFEKLLKRGESAPDTARAASDACDRELFLAAMRKSGPKPEQKGGFLLSEQCSLPKLPMKKRKSSPSPRPAAPKVVEETDAELFAVAMRNATPLAGKGREIVPAKASNAPRPATDKTLADYLAGKIEFAISSSDEYMEGNVVGIDPLIMGRLRQGQFSPEAHLDMHGQNADQAFEALREFMQQAWYKGLHTVLLIPGRGRNSIDGYGILRQKLPYWLTHEPFKRIVLGFCTAKPHDGGPGSIYVLLRKSRKKGPIRWETLAWGSGDD